MCPTCRVGLSGADGLTCAGCGRSAIRKGRLLDFSGLTPEVKLGLAEMVAGLHASIAPKYPDLSGTWRVRRALQEITRLACSGMVLEIGGGEGAMTPGLESPFDTVVSIDHSLPFLERIISKTQKAICVLGEALFLPIADHSVDFVVCTEVLEHVMVPTQLLLEIRRVLAPRGLLYLTVPNCVEALNPFRVSHSGLLAARDTHVNFFGLHGLQRLLVRCGFQIQRLNTARDTKAMLRMGLRCPRLLRHLFPAWGTMAECVATPLPDPIPYWRSFAARHA